MKTAQELFERAATIMLDEGIFSDRRTSLAEMCRWLNDGLLAIVMQKPSACVKTVSVSLAEGTLQTIPSGYLSILRVVRNVRGTATDRKPRKTISVVTAEMMDANNPAWHDSYVVRYDSQVKHVIFDEANPKTFYVYPGNDGTGTIEMVLATVPTAIAATGDTEELDSYATAIPLDETYHNTLLDWVLYRSYSKDAQNAGAANRAALHYQQFAQALGMKIGTDANLSPNMKAGITPVAGGVVPQSQPAGAQ